MALAAVPVGFSAGFFGIGGGLISVPVLFYIFESLGLSSDYIMHLAVGTSFSIIVPTSISSVLTHNKYNSVDFNVVKSFGLFVVIGVILGTIFASTLKTQQLVLFFSIVTFCLGNYLIFLKEKEVNTTSIFKTKYKKVINKIESSLTKADKKSKNILLAALAQVSAQYMDVAVEQLPEVTEEWKKQA